MTSRNSRSIKTRAISFAMAVVCATVPMATCYAQSPTTSRTQSYRSSQLQTVQKKNSKASKSQQSGEAVAAAALFAFILLFASQSSQPSWEESDAAAKRNRERTRNEYLQRRYSPR